MGRPKKEVTKAAQLGIRVDPPLLREIDELVALLQERTPGMEVTRSDAMRVAILEGITVLKRKGRR